MIERKFEETGKIFDHELLISEDKKYCIANPNFIVSCTDVLNVSTYLEEKGYEFMFEAHSSLYFRRKENEN